MKPITEEEIDAMMDEWQNEMIQISKQMEGALTPAELRRCEARMKVLRDNYNVVRSAERRGYAEGFALGLKQGRAIRMKAEGYPLQYIADITGLSIEEINKLGRSSTLNNIICERQHRFSSCHYGKMRGKCLVLWWKRRNFAKNKPKTIKHQNK